VGRHDLRTIVVGCCVALLATAQWACEGMATAVVAPDDPPGGPSIVASIGPPIAPEATGFTRGGGPPPAFDLTIFVSSTVDLDHVMIHMLDGSNLGGPMIPVPRAELTTQFGNVRIVGGTTRSFRFHPSIWVASCPRFVEANVTMVDVKGTPYRTKVTRSWP
jgi:hypothetical protein